MRMPKWLTGSIQSRGILAAVGAVLVIVVIATTNHEFHQTNTATSTPILALPTGTGLQGAETTPAATSTATSTSSHSVASATSTAPKMQMAAAVTAIDVAPSTPPASVVAARQLDGAGSKLLKSLVNIVCISSVHSIPSISGSGVIIDSRGIILTAAHVAQLFLLQDYLGPDKVACIIRTGSPARRSYLAEPIYVSPSWIEQNPSTLTTSSPTGTGENDFALLGITGTATSTPLPNSFPAIPLASDDPQQQDSVAIGSYGAQYLTASELNYSLYPILVFGTIQDRYTYDTNTVDLVSVIGSAASQEGSSGGGLVNAAGQLIGDITTSSVAGTLTTRSLNAITIGHIRRSYTTDTGQDLDSALVQQSVPSLIAGFASESKQLGRALYKNL